MTYLRVLRGCRIAINLYRGWLFSSKAKETIR
jgi:hypothetical protein